MSQEADKVITKEDIGYPTNFIHTYHVGPGDEINIEDDDPFKIVVPSVVHPVEENGEEDEDKESEKRVTKSDIGNPTDFRHSVHVSVNESGGFNIATDDESLSDFLRKSGISETHLQEDDAPELILEYIDKQLEREEMEANPKFEFLKNFKAYLLQGKTKEEPTTSLEPTTAAQDGEEQNDTKQAKTITKDDIGHPTDFQHVTHISCNEDDGFIIETNDETLSEFFKKAGVTETDLQDGDTLEFILDYIEKHLQKEKEEVSNKEFLKNLKEYLLHFRAKYPTLTRRHKKKKKGESKCVEGETKVEETHDNAESKRTLSKTVVEQVEENYADNESKPNSSKTVVDQMELDERNTESKHEIATASEDRGG